MKPKKSTLIAVLAFFLIIMMVPAVSFAVDVSAECAYSATNLVCEIYVNTDGDILRSGGVMLSYNPAELLGPTGTIRPIATKNESDWYFGAGGPEHTYMDPETSIDGEVVFIVGMLDTTDTALGVIGTRVPVGTVTFERATSTFPVSDPSTLFGVGLAFGRSTPYINFVNTAGTSLDDTGAVSFGAPIIVESGSDLSIEITRAEYKANIDTLIIFATSDLNENAELTADIPGIGLKAMAWNSTKLRWQKWIAGAVSKGFDPANPGSVIVSGNEGSVSQPISVIYDLSIEITKADYKVTEDILIVRATSDRGDQAGLRVTVELAAGGSITRNMVWNADKTRWQKWIGDFDLRFGSQPVSVTVFGAEGSVSSIVSLQ